MKVHSFLNTILLVNGVEIGGWAEGDEVFDADRLEDSASHISGADGVMIVSLNSSNAGTMKVRLSQTSDSNVYLSGLILLQENGVFTPLFVQYKDVVTGEIVSGSQGYILKPAQIKRGVKANSQEWTFNMERLDMLHIGA